MNEYCLNSSIIFSKPDKIWDLLIDWYNWSWFAFAKKVEKEKIIEDLNCTELRMVNDNFLEGIIHKDSSSYIFKYSIFKGPNDFDNAIISNFVGTVEIKLLERENASLVMWKTEWENLRPNKLYKSTDVICKRILYDLGKALNSYG